MSKLPVLLDLWESVPKHNAKDFCNATKGVPNEKVELDAIEKRQRAKFITQEYLRHLIDLDSDLHNSYVSSQQCSSSIYIHENKATSQYCKQRWCQVCNRIKTAQLINGYMPQFQKFEQPYFVTLTTRNVPAFELAEMLQVYQVVWRTIYKRIKKSKLPLQGIKKIECTYNSEFDSYHPHFHFIINDKNIAEALLENWMAEMVTGDLFLYGAELPGQNIKQADLGSMLEIFKYFTKVFAKPNKKGERFIFIPALDNIFNCMKNRRVFEPFGIRKISEKIEKLNAQEYELHIKSADVFQWNFDQWYYGHSALTKHQISETMRSIGKNIIL